MRCVICDASDVGLSTYRSDGHFHAMSFVRVGEDIYCSECSGDIDEAYAEFSEGDDDEDLS